MASAPESYRLFVAVELPDNVRNALAGAQTALKQKGLGGLRWVRPEAIHLTLKFLGETPAERAPEIEAAIGRAVAGSGPLELSLAAPGVFGPGGHPRVIWMGLEGDVSRLAALQRRVEAEMAGLAFPREERPFSPHLTLARVPPELAQTSGMAIMKALADTQLPTGAFRVTEVSLMRSELKPDGAVYTRLAASSTIVARGGITNI